MSKTTAVKASKSFELQKQSLNNSALTNGQACKKQPLNGEYPAHNVKCISNWVCKNLACKAVLTSEDSFCKRCSCCICHLFDDNKDPSLWLVCASEKDDKNCCGSSCHIECALDHNKVGCFDLGRIMRLDGSYSCDSCGKVSGILGCWKRQLAVAKDARRVDILCYRLYLSFRLLEGTAHFKELHQIIEDAKAKLESEVGPLDGTSAKTTRAIVSRLSAGSDVQKLCSLAIQRADEWLCSQSDLHLRDSLPAACRFRFEDITSSSLIVILKEMSLGLSEDIKGYKLWYWKSRGQPCMEEPVTLSKDQRKIVVYNLAPCTEYSFRIITFTDDGIVGHSESKCYTGSKEVFFKHENAVGVGSRTERRNRSQTFRSTGFKIRNVGKILQKAWAEEGCIEDMHDDLCGGSAIEQPENSEQEHLVSAVSRKLQMNSFSVPDLNVEAPIPMDMDYSPENWCNSKNGLIRSNDSGGSETCAVGQNAEPPAVESWPEGNTKQLHSAHGENCEQDGTLSICKQKQHFKRQAQLDEEYEYCVKVIRWLECLGHIENDFRMKFLTWFSIRSTEEERRVVNTFIQTLIEEPSSLAGQLVDSFRETIYCKRPRTGFCSKLWH